MRQTLVLKFGGASLASPEHFAAVAQTICERKRDFARVVVVVSAMGDTTDELMALAHRVNPNPPQREMDMLVTVGERISISLMAMALDRLHCKALSFTGSQSGIITSNAHTDARIVKVKPQRVERCLDAGKVAIVAGFQGVSQEFEITTLGRGGSDTSAVALAVALDAERVEFYKDVPGIFAADPKKFPGAQHYPQMTYDEVLDIVHRGGHQVLHPRCLVLAKDNGMPLHVRSFSGGALSTQIGEGAVRSTQPIFECDASVQFATSLG